MNIETQLSHELRTVRLRFAMRSTTLAMLLGIEPNDIDEWESGDSVPSLAIILKFAQIFQLSDKETNKLLAYGERTFARDRASEFIPIENADTLEIHFNSQNVDLYALGMYHMSIQSVIDIVAFHILSHSGYIETLTEPSKPSSQLPLGYQRIVRAKTKSIQAGSLIEVFFFGISPLLDNIELRNYLINPDVRAVLTSLAANVVWTIASQGVQYTRGFRNSLSNRSSLIPEDQVPDIRDILDQMNLMLRELNNPEEAKVYLKAESPNGGRIEARVNLRYASNISARKIDINIATHRELTELPRIGSVIAKRIIENRPYSNIEELLEIRGLSDGILNDISAFIII